MSGYSKLFSTLVNSTIWTQESKETRLVWITMLAMKNWEHVVESSIPGLARMAGVTIQECEVALERLKAPDPYSRTKDYEGRRIEDVAGGWFILNGDAYRRKMSKAEQLEYQRIKQAEYRERQKRAIESKNGKPPARKKKLPPPPGQSLIEASVARGDSPAETARIAARVEQEIEELRQNKLREELSMECPII